MELESRVFVLENNHRQLDSRILTLEQNIESFREEIQNMRNESRNDMQDVKKTMTDVIIGAQNAQPEWAARDSKRVYTTNGILIGVIVSLIGVLATIGIEIIHVYPK